MLSSTGQSRVTRKSTSPFPQQLAFSVHLRFVKLCFTVTDTDRARYWFMTAPPVILYDPNIDVNNDLSINMADISIAIDHFMK